jgi:BirA family biotin operon repressor/biotin-[acetyl-CoA-carboxylase] ligase
MDSRWQSVTAALSPAATVVCSHVMWQATIDIDRIKQELCTVRIGRHIEHLTSTSSTNDEAWQRIDADYADGMVILAEHQSVGRGRLGRVWHSPRGAGLLCSVAVLDRAGELSGGDLGLLTAVAACDAIGSCTEIIPAIKWPNDLRVSGKKLGGVLVEARNRRDGVQTYVLGTGINCLQQHGHFPEELADAATSLELESRQAIDRTALAVSLLTELDRWLAEPQSWDYGQLHSAWLSRCESIGGYVVLRCADRVYRGTVIDVDPKAALVVQLDEGGLRKFRAADTTIVAPDTMVST